MAVSVTYIAVTLMVLRWPSYQRFRAALLLGGSSHRSCRHEGRWNVENVVTARRALS